MNRATPTMRQFAERLIKNETWSKAAPPGASSIFLVTEKLRAPLSTLMGKAGYRAIVARSLALAKKEVAWLERAHVGADGRLEGIGESNELDPAQLAESQLVLVAHLLTLLITFIGPALTVQLVHEIWPSVITDDLNFGKGN